jgi:hypothetical protein
MGGTAKAAESNPRGAGVRQEGEGFVNVNVNVNVSWLAV